MESRVGVILHEARARRRIELSEVEAATRIRVRFLRAIEEEEWEALPGGVYTRGFIRTYASFLGLDGDRLATDYRESVEGDREGASWPTGPPNVAAAGGTLGDRQSGSRIGWIALPIVALVAAIAILVLPDGGSNGGDGNGARRQTQAEGAPHNDRSDQAPAAAPHSSVSVSLAATAEVWICMLDGQGEPLVDGLILEAGAEEGPFRSGSFTVSFGNGEVSMLIDGKQAEVPASASPLGYSIDSSGRLTELSDAERPTCA